MALAIAAVTLVFLFVNPDYRPGVWGCAIWFLTGIVWFALHGRRHLVKSPEEAFAINERARAAGVAAKATRAAE